MKAIYPGTFDPFTKGHIDIVQRGSKIFDELIIAVAENKNKNTLFSLEERKEMVEASVQEFKNVKVETFDCLLVHYMQQKGINVILRGLRAVSDFDFELQLALMNRKLYPECENVFLMPNKKYIFLSSSMVKEIATLGGNFDMFVSEAVSKKLKEKFSSI
jgi:pantetheine-phosphate adenylyltransferase